MTDFSWVDLPWSSNADSHRSPMGGISLFSARLPEPVMRHTQTKPHKASVDLVSDQFVFGAQTVQSSKCGLALSEPVEVCLGSMVTWQPYLLHRSCQGWLTLDCLVMVLSSKDKLVWNQVNTKCANCIALSVLETSQMTIASLANRMRELF